MRISDWSSDVCSSDLAGEAFGRVLVDDLGVALLGHLRSQVAHARRALHGDVDDARALQAEDDAALQRGGGVVEMDDGPAGSADRIAGAVEQVITCMDQHLDGDLYGHQIPIAHTP